MASSDTQANGRQSPHPATSEQIESKLVARNIEFVFEPNYPIRKVLEAHHVRVGAYRAHKETAERYAEQMKAGAIFPAIVVNDRGELVDGYTRRAAALKNGQEVIPAYVCSNVSASEARSLSVELNRCHGLPMTEEEIRAFVTSAVREGQVLDAKTYARMTGTKPSALARWVAATHFRMRAEREGVSASDIAGLSESAQAALQAARLRSVFVRVTGLAVAANMPAAQIRRLVTQANNALSEADALSLVAAEREAQADGSAGNGYASRRSAGSGLHIGGLLRFDVDDLLDVAPEKQQETFIRLRGLRELLDGVLAKATSTWSVPAAVQESAGEYAEIG